MIEYLGPCAHCRCSIYYDPIEGERYYTTDDPDCRCELQEDLDVVAAIEKGLEKNDRTDEEKYYPNLNEDDYRKER